MKMKMQNLVNVLFYLTLGITSATILSGCAGVQQAINASEASAVVNLRAAEDNNLKVLVFGICATPYSAIIRHPEIVPGVSALCLPNGNMSNPANLLNPLTVPSK